MWTKLMFYQYFYNTVQNKPKNNVDKECGLLHPKCATFNLSIGVNLEQIPAWGERANTHILTDRRERRGTFYITHPVDNASWNDFTQIHYWSVFKFTTARGLKVCNKSLAGLKIRLLEIGMIRYSTSVFLHSDK